MQLALTEKENVTIFKSNLSSAYYDKLIVYASTSFVNLLQTGESIENGHKTDKIKGYYTLSKKS